MSKKRGREMITSGGGSLPPITPDNALPFFIALIIVLGVLYVAAKEFFD